MEQTERVSFIDAVAFAVGFDVKLVEGAFVYAGDGTFPDARGATGDEVVRLGIPSIEAADD
jgi:hypothetical protein